jgi:hypothetical protein
MSRDATLLGLALVFAVLLGVFLWGLVRLVALPAVDPTPTPPPAAILTATRPTLTLTPYAPFLMQPPSPELLLATPLATATETPTAVPPTPRPERSPVQRG